MALTPVPPPSHPMVAAGKQGLVAKHSAVTRLLSYLALSDQLMGINVADCFLNEVQTPEASLGVQWEQRWAGVGPGCGRWKPGCQRRTFRVSSYL